MATGYCLADPRIVLGNSRLADGTHAVQPSADPTNLFAEGEDATISVSLYAKWGSRFSFYRPPRT
jgi:hypothetical protein